MGHREQYVGLSSAVLASQRQSSTSVQWLLVRVATGANSCASVTALRMVKKNIYEANINFMKYVSPVPKIP